MQLIEEEAVSGRVRICGFLAGVFCSVPTVESVHAVLQMALALGLSCPEGLSVSELEREFMDLFVIPNPRYVAPYESVYRDQWTFDPALGAEPGQGPAPLIMERLLMGESTMAVRQAYLEAGVLPEKDLPDHIANELRFMAYLWAREAEAHGDEARAWAELRNEFRQAHLLKWISPLRERVAECGQSGYYRVALQVAEALLQNDADIK